MSIPNFTTVLMITAIQCLSLKGIGQEYVNDEAGREKHFVYEVKQIDEFFERFNDDSSSYIRKVYRIYHQQFKPDRTLLIKSLFNYETQVWDSALINDFVSAVLQNPHPVFLNFYHEGWYAEVNCLFRYNESFVRIPLVLKILSDEDGSSRWVIAAIKSNPVKTETPFTEILVPRHKNKFINPESHANNFIQLQDVFSDRQNFADYLDVNFFERHNSKPFYSAFINNKLHFVSVKDIKYHFLQVDDWVFTVSHFLRDALNSGWLINQLSRVSETAKEQYKKNLLEE